MTTVYLVFFEVGPFEGDEFRRIFRTNDAAQAWIDGQRFPVKYYIREEELE